MDFKALKAEFQLPDGVIYLDGNSLGPLPKIAASRVATVVRDEWGEMLIGGWNKAGWMAMPSLLGDRIGRLIGAPAGSVVVGDTLSVKIYQALAAALEMRPGRKVILSDTGNFPSDLYMAEGLARSLGQGHKVKLAEPDGVAQALTQDVAVLMLTEVDYRTGRRHDMDHLTALAHGKGALVIWDLAHSAGALPVDITAGGADFAAGCTYKYLNAGPGAPAFIYVRPDLQAAVLPTLSGWLGHEAPFAFDPGYRPGAGVERMRVGTPPVLQMAALEAALDIWERVDMHALRARSIELSERLIVAVSHAAPDLALASPREASKRGSQVSFRHPEGYAIMQALIARGVVGDFRAPDILRFGITPLYLDEADIDAAAAILGEILRDRSWDRPEYRTRAAVT
jgi:kynureninase